MTFDQALTAARIRLSGGVSDAQAALAEQAGNLVQAAVVLPTSDGAAKMKAVMDGMAILLGVIVPFLPVQWKILYWLAPKAVLAWYVSQSVVEGMYQAFKPKLVTP